MYINIFIFYFYSAPSRKISETSISSDPKKKYPKLSIHSSVSDNISFHSANYMHLKNEVIYKLTLLSTIYMISLLLFIY